MWFALAGLAAPADETPAPLHTGSITPYVHRITLYDEDGVAIAPGDVPVGAYSPRATCGKCHDYATISSGWHFNAGSPDVDAGRPGEPWVLTDPLTSTQLPVSLRPWSGTYSPGEVGLTRWEFLLEFGRHLPGGGFTEPDARTAAQTLEALRWAISGTLQIDCMVCHSCDRRYDRNETAKQIAKENFRWIPTAAMGLAVVRGEARKAPDDWDPLMPPNPDFPEQSGPSLVYDTSRFDPDDRVFFDITRNSPDYRCYFCHATREVGPGSPEAWQIDQDVHLSAGLGCTDCHRHGLDHAMTRAYEGEMGGAAAAVRPDLTCRGCHIGGREPAASGGTASGGQFGAPYPLHRGIPPLHLELLACTACHSGPKPTADIRRFQTARAHGLGVGSTERTDTTPPEIFGPVYLHTTDGKLNPCLMVWPAFWGWMTGGEIEPIRLEQVAWAIREALPDREVDTGQLLEPLTQDEVLQVLSALAEKEADGGEYVFVRAGRARRLGADGEAVMFDHPVAAPYYWPIGHNVRPAAQSLGSGGCIDCHAVDAPFSFGRVVPETGQQVDRPPTELMFELQGSSPALLRVWASSFEFRLAFKILGMGCAGVLATVLLVHGLAAASALLRMCR